MHWQLKCLVRRLGKPKTQTLDLIIYELTRAENRREHSKVKLYAYHKKYDTYVCANYILYNQFVLFFGIIIFCFDTYHPV